MAIYSSTGTPVNVIRFTNSAQITSTTDPLLRFYADTTITPLCFRCTPLSTFDRTTGDETYVLSVEDDTTKISTDNAAVGATNAIPIEATFVNKTIAQGSVVELIATLGGTSPIIPANSLFEFFYS